jgi:peptidoglycan hydrolase-like protein with peptidoglycan-binding domain
MQKALGITDDGSFGSGTRDKVKAFQEKHHLTKDGIAGPQTLTAIYALAANKTPPIKLSTQPAAKAPGEKTPLPASLALLM